MTEAILRDRMHRGSFSERKPAKAVLERTKREGKLTIKSK